MKSETSAVENKTVPHAETTHFRFTEVVGAKDSGYPVLQIDDDESVVWLTRSRHVRRVNDGELGGPPGVWWEVEMLLHPCDVWLRRLDKETRSGTKLRVGTDISLYQEHVLGCDIGILFCRPLVGLR